MNLTLLWCWKEWRSQRALLGSYAFLVFASLCCVFLLVSEEFWQRTGGAHVLGWFVAAGVIGVVAFAVPQLVRSEFGAKDDTFVRRLPGALWPSFQGKLLFLLLVAAAFPTTGLALGELFLTVTGHSWNDLFTETGNAYSEARLDWPVVLCYAAWGMAAVPWIWMVGTWLPGGRMAIGGTLLMGLLLGLGVFAVLRRCEGLATTLVWSWQPWACGAIPFGLLIAGLSWVRGRRGGGNYRSARIGLSSLAVGLLAPAGWLGSWAFRYHHPDLEHVEYLQVEGLSPDLHYALGRATSDANWHPVPVRIDLVSGAIAQLGGIYTTVEPGLLSPSVTSRCPRQRYWHVAEWEDGVHEVLDLVTGERRHAEYDVSAFRLVVPADLMPAIVSDARANSPLRAPDGVQVSVVGEDMWFTHRDGSVEHRPWTLPARALWPEGHGVLAFVGKARCLYDFTRGQQIAVPNFPDAYGYAIKGIWLLSVSGGDGKWRRFNPDSGCLEVCAELRNASIIGMFEDDSVLCERAATRKRIRRPHSSQVAWEWSVPELFRYRPEDGSVTPLSLPTEMESDHRWWPLRGAAIVEGPGVAGHHVMMCSDWNGRRGFLLIDPESLATDFHVMRPASASAGPEAGWDWLLARTGDGALLLANHKQIARVNVLTGETNVLFPRAR